MQFKPLCQLPANGQYGIERCPRLLKYHGNSIPTNGPHFPLRQLEQINSIQQDLPPHDSPGRVGHQLKHRQRTDAFSRCALSHHGHTFSPAYRIGETVYGPQHFAVHIEISL